MNCALNDAAALRKQDVRSAVRVSHIVICSLSLFFSTGAAAADASGFVRTEGCDLLTANHFHLESFDHRAIRKTIILKLPGPLEEAGNDWFEVPGMECSGDEQCVPVLQAKIQIARISHRWWGRWAQRHEMSGEYSIRLSDGMELQGSFEAKFRKPTKLTCE